jgi:Mn-dependent DtxR family transcriptional regulator
MEELLGKAIVESRHVEKDTELETSKEQILLMMLRFRKENKVVNDSVLWKAMGKPSKTSYANAILELQEEQLITIEWGHMPLIHLTQKGDEKASEIYSSLYD